MKSIKEWPEPEDYVICTITELNPNSAVAVLDEYDHRKGMIHVSEVANRIVRDIRKFVKIGNKEVAKVLFVDSSRGFVGLSLKRVKPTIRREKILEFKNEKKAENLLNFAAKSLKKTLDQAYDEAGYLLMQKYDDLLYPAFELAKTHGKKALIKEGVAENWAAAIADIAEKNIKEREVIKSVNLIIQTFAPEGVIAIKNALDVGGENGVEIMYVSAPVFRLKVRGADYHEVESKIGKITKNVETLIKKSGGDLKVEEAEI